MSETRTVPLELLQDALAALQGQHETDVLVSPDGDIQRPICAALQAAIRGVHVVDVLQHFIGDRADPVRLAEARAICDAPVVVATVQFEFMTDGGGLSVSTTVPADGESHRVDLTLFSSSPRTVYAYRLRWGSGPWSFPEPIRPFEMEPNSSVVVSLGIRATT